MRWRIPALAVLAALFVASVAIAAGGTGWSAGTPAKSASRVLTGLAEPVELQLPKGFAARIDGPTYLVYFSPSCPHCQQAQPELNELARRVRGKAQVVGVASDRTGKDAVAAYQRTYKVAYPIVHDEVGDIAAAMGARSTPSVLFVVPSGRKLIARDAWYPFRRGTSTLLAMRAEADPWAAFDKDRYQGRATCSACHLEEAEAWMLSLHSVAWETLQARGDDDKPECVGCHVTGYEQPTGWTTGDHHLVDVGCESCHGPGGPHDGNPTDARSTCAGCHDAKHSIAFTVDKGMPHIDHFAANGLDDATFRERLQALHSGERERPLLAFAEGPHVGSAACRSCHEAEYTWWEADPHRKAMASLADQTHAGAAASQAVECVRCHASPTSHGGPSPTALDGFLPAEGVGCESCHGPGGAHVAAEGGKDNIEGLGDDCPVCVLEALCTGCHTSTWDAGWDLDKRLKAVHHGP
jgi:thiol-disulfide isomerase/thioredoxin